MSHKILYRYTHTFTLHLKDIYIIYDQTLGYFTKTLTKKICAYIRNLHKYVFWIYYSLFNHYNKFIRFLRIIFLVINI